MGIPSYFTYLVKNHRNILNKLNDKNIKVDNLYLDSNSIIYDAVNKIKFENKLDYENKVIRLVCEKLKSYINLIKPKNKVLIAFDGIAPLAKLDQQRNRRYKSWFQGEINNRINKENTSNWSTAAITPGTNFMIKLNQEIKKEFNEANNYNLQSLIVSSSDECGEGEHKIYKYIRDNHEYHRDTVSVIYGLDADLIMLTLQHLKYSENLYLFRNHILLKI